MGTSMSLQDHDHDGQQQQQQQVQAVQTLSRLLQEDPVPWNDVRRTLQENPEQACMYAHGIEDSQLYVAITRPGGCPVDIVKRMLEADEDALEYTNNSDDSGGDGHTLLHAAVFAAPVAGTIPRNNEDGDTDTQGDDDDDDAAQQIVQLILSQPNGRSLARTTNRKGMLPLHVCRSKAIAEILLQANPSAVCHRSIQTGSLPLHHVLMDDVNRIDIDLCHYLVQQTLMRNISKAGSGNCSHVQLGGIFCRNKHGKTPLSLLLDHLDDDMIAITNRNKMWSILRRTFLPVMMSTATHTKGLELHTLVDYRCLHSERLMELALNVFGHQASLRDGLGRTPLHVAVADTGSCRCSYEALQCLIRSNPKAPRMCDNDGRLPIDWAAECPHVSNRNLALLMKGEPRAIDTRDLRDRRYPFVSAALKEHKNSINNTYMLLRAKPHVLSYFHTP